MTLRISCFLCVLLVAAPASSQTPKENFLLLLIDDAGIEKFGTFGTWQQHGLPTPITPRIDALAAEGVRFRNVWSNSVCSPTRAMLLSGRHAFATGMGTNPGRSADPNDPTIVVGGPYSLPLSEVVLPEIFPAGYSARRG